MDVEALRTFVAIRRGGGITRAAEAVHLSQPAVSRRLAALEADLGAPLFERTVAGMTLTAAGEALLPHAEAAIAALDDAVQAVRAVLDAPVGAVRFALVGSLAGSRVTPALRAFVRRHPAVDLQLRTATSGEVSDLVRRADADVGLRYRQDPDPRLRSERLMDEHMVVVASAGHPLAGRRVRRRELRRERWLTFPDVPGRPEAANREVRRTLESIGVPDEDVLGVDSLTAQKRLVEAGFGVTLVPSSAVEEELAAGSLVALDVAGLDVSVPVYVMTRAGGYVSAAALTLLDELRDALAVEKAPNLR